MEFLDLQVYERYKVIDGVLTPSGNVKRTYNPLEHTAIVNEFGRLGEGDTRAVERFALKWGSLGYQHKQADPVSWIWAHARNVRLIFAILEILQNYQVALDFKNEDEDEFGVECAREDAHDFIETLTVEDEKTGNTYIGFVGGLIDKSVLWQWEINSKDANKELRLMANIISKLLTYNVLTVGREAIVTPDLTIKSKFKVPTLIQAIYWMLMDIAEGGELGKCKFCGSYFIRQSKREKYCPPTDPKKESKCALAYRQRKYRKPKEEKDNDKA
ncbi:MAG: hypothetical protein AB1500_07730 [Bacillota bacterium]